VKQGNMNGTNSIEYQDFDEKENASLNMLRIGKEIIARFILKLSEFSCKNQVSKSS